MSVEIISQSDISEWDSLVMNSPCGTIFHSSKWITTSAKLFSKKEILYGYFKGNNLLGGCSVYSEQRYGFFSIAKSNISMTPYGGYVLFPFKSTTVRNNEQHRSSIISEINQHLISRFHSIRIVNSPDFYDIRPFLWSGWNSFINYAYVMNLNKNIEDNLPKAKRRTIRLAADHYKISIEKETNFDLFYNLYEKMYKKQYLPYPNAKDFFSQMIDMIVSNNFGEMWIARSPGDEPAAAEIIIWDNKRAYRWAAAMDPQFKSMGPVSLLLFEIFRDLKKRNCQGINLMAANNHDLAKFISGFNPDLIPYYGIEKPHMIQKILHLIR